MRVWSLLGLVCATSASAGGFSFEVHGALAGRLQVGAALSLSARLGDVGRHEVRLRGIGVVERQYPGPLTGGASLGYRYRALLTNAEQPIRGALTIGTGGQLWLGCLNPSSCGGGGPYVEGGPAVDFLVSPATRVSLSLDVTVGLMVNRTVEAVVAVTAGVGVSFELFRFGAAPRREERREEIDY